jgi:hypothetical protein
MVLAGRGSQSVFPANELPERRDSIIFALSHGAHSDAKILFAVGEKDGETNKLGG